MYTESLIALRSILIRRPATMPIPISPPRMTESWMEMSAGQLPAPPSSLSRMPKP